MIVYFHVSNNCLFDWGAICHAHITRWNIVVPAKWSVVLHFLKMRDNNRFFPPKFLFYSPLSIHARIVGQLSELRKCRITFGNRTAFGGDSVFAFKPEEKCIKNSSFTLNMIRGFRYASILVGTLGAFKERK